MLIGMEERDARTLKAAAQEELRRQAIKLLNKGMIQQDVADLLGVSRRAVGNWLKKYQSGGWSSLQKGKRGRKAEVHAQLTQSQEQEVQKLMCDKTPDQRDQQSGQDAMDGVERSTQCGDLHSLPEPVDQIPQT